MLVHVKTPLIELEVKGDKYQPLMDLLEKDFGESLEIIEDDEEFIDIADTDWYKKTVVSPGDMVRIHRGNIGLTQAQLGTKIGSKSKQYISDIEKGRRQINISMAKALGEALGHNYKSYL